MTKYCPNCGQEVKVTSRYCPECGFNLSYDSLLNEKQKNGNKKSKNKHIIIVLLIIVIILGGIFIALSLTSNASTHEIQFIGQGFAFNVSNDYETNSTYNVDTVSMDVLFETNHRNFHVCMMGSKYLDELPSYTSNTNGWKQLEDLKTLDGCAAHIFESRSNGGYACFIENPNYDESLDGFGINTYMYVYIGASDYNDARIIIESFHWTMNSTNATANATQSITSNSHNSINTGENNSDSRDMNDGIIDDDEAGTNGQDGFWGDLNDNSLQWILLNIFNKTHNLGSNFI